MATVKENDTVVVHYTGRLQDGQVFDSSEGRDPLEVSLGQGQLIPGFEQGLVGMQPNDKKTVNIPMQDAYGEVRKELFQKIDKQELPDDIDPKVGMGLMAQNPDGSQRQLRVAEVEDDHIVIDANHPLAGQDLIFDLEVVEIKG